MKPGGLLNELEERIDMNQSYLCHYEMKINKLKNQNNKLNLNWNDSFKNDWLEKNEINMNNYNDLIDYRQDLINEICNNNNYIEQLKIKFNEILFSNSFYQRLYWCIQKLLNFKKL